MDLDYDKIVSSKVCRICLKLVEAGRSIFDGEPSYYNLLRDLTGCQMLPCDMLPNILCDFCARTLISLNGFIKLCRDSELRIQTILREGPPIDIKLEPILALKSSYLEEERLGKVSDERSYQGDNDNVSDEFDEPDRRLSCKICSMKVQSNSALIVHLRKHTGEKPYICDTCDRKFTQKGTLIQHIKRLHLKYEWAQFTCEICGKQKRTKNDLNIHIRIHTKEKPHKCSICSAAFAQAGTLQHHMRVHTGEKPYSCKICSRSFTAKNSLKRHMISHSDERHFQCHMCNNYFKSKFTLKQHFLLHSAEMPHSCKECGKSFRTFCSMKFHMKAMHSELSGYCAECNNKHFSNLPEHMKIHSGEKPFACEYCDKKFAQKRSWTHHTNKHKNATKFMCHIEECNKGFPDSYKLEYHKLKFHSESVPFSCKLCPRKFYRSSDLKKHCKTCFSKSTENGESNVRAKSENDKIENNIN